MTEQNSNEVWSGRDSAAVIMVGIFWLIAIFVVLSSKNIPPVKRYRIALYGTFIMMALVMAFGLMS